MRKLLTAENGAGLLEISQKASMVALTIAAFCTSHLLVRSQGPDDDGGPDGPYPDGPGGGPIAMPFNEFIGAVLPADDGNPPYDAMDMTAAGSMSPPGYNNGYDSKVFGKFPNRLNIYGLYDYRQPGFYNRPYAGLYAKTNNYPPRPMNYRPASYRQPDRQYPGRPYGKPGGNYPMQKSLPITFDRSDGPRNNYPNYRPPAPRYTRNDEYHRPPPPPAYGPALRQPKDYDTRPAYGGSAYSPDFYRLAEEPPASGPPPGYLHMLEQRRRTHNLLLLYLLTHHR
ncbi:uncharacterized protein LOC129587906 [Paramacrobiotus metropolitanus]|uniref:uncharacterized protein LOC129587906 n=1 Tax=Paramacrobiotus metropolitanus TaxID=2943436 RepID=UPI0024456E92|nr:uncharacterized protein LOC129587906 [Paramacrobiotus metropolitanus]